MSTSSTNTPTPQQQSAEPLRLRLADEASPDRADGSWWPRSRDLQREAADLVDHFPVGQGRIHRLLFSRPDWDNSSKDGRGVRSIRAARGPVKVGSFPSDDTHLMILTMSSGRRVKLVVIPSDTPAAEAEERLDATARNVPTGSAATGDAGAGERAVDEGAVDRDRWDDEHPVG